MQTTLIACVAGFLLGSGGTDSESGALAAYVPDRDTRCELIAAIAEECAAAAQVFCASDMSYTLHVHVTWRMLRAWHLAIWSGRRLLQQRC